MITLAKLPTTPVGAGETVLNFSTTILPVLSVIPFLCKAGMFAQGVQWEETLPLLITLNLLHTFLEKTKTHLAHNTPEEMASSCANGGLD